MNNVGSTILSHPVFINLEQVIIFRRVHYGGPLHVLIAIIKHVNILSDRKKQNKTEVEKIAKYINVLKF